MPNPIDNRAFYTRVVVGGRATPGKLIDIQMPEGAEEWMAINDLTNGQALQWKRRPLITGIKVIVSLNARDDAEVRKSYADHYAFIVHLKGKNRRAKPPAYGVTNTVFKDQFIQKIVYAGHAAAKFLVGAPILVTYTFNEYEKATLLPVGPPEAAKTSDTNPVPADKHEADLVAWIQKATESNPQ